MPVTDPNANTLFDRLPRTVFRPLAAANNTRYWDLLGRLVDEFWGDGARTPGEDVPKSELIAALESYLVVSDPWEAEDGAAPDTPANIRAHGIYSVFRDSGWLSQRKRGVRDMATIRPVLAQFHTLLREFGTKEPEFLGSEVRSVFLNLQEAAGGKGDAYAKAAREAKHCMTHLASTGVAVYDLMASLQSVASTREFVAGYFDDFIRRHFIGDYHELRTKGAPTAASDRHRHFDAPDSTRPGAAERHRRLVPTQHRRGRRGSGRSLFRARHPPFDAPGKRGGRTSPTG